MDRDKAIKYMHDLLRTMVQKDGSDLFITAGAVPSIKVDGSMKPLSNQALSPQHIRQFPGFQNLQKRRHPPEQIRRRPAY